MERVLKHTSFKSIVLILFFLCLAQSSFATTVTIPSDDDMLVGARAILRGKVVAIESSLEESSGRIYTYVTVKVQEVYKGQITERRVVLKELGGRVGDRASIVYGNPQFKKGEKVLLYLDTWADGSLRTYQMFLGKFNIETDPSTGEEIAVRSTPDENTTILKQQLHGHGAPGVSTEKQVLRRYVRMVRNRLAANWQRSVQFDAEVYSDKPLVAEPAEYRLIEGRGEVTPNYTFLGPFRFFQPDTGQPVPFALNPNPSGQPGVPQVSLNPSDVTAAGGAWSNVTGCSLQMSYSGAEEDCYLGSGVPGIHIVSNNCDGRNGATAGCASILAWGGISQTGFQTRVINGTTFSQSIQGFVSMNPWANCSFTSCNVREILTHEIGHALGLGHSQFNDATMAPFAHFDGRCASIRADDVNGICAIYPGSGGGPGPLSVVTTSLAGGTVGSAYSQTLSASGGTLPYTWSLVPGQGTLPPGLNLSTGGVISGNPTTAGPYNFTVRVTDNPGATAQRALSILVSAGGGGGALNSQFVSQNVPTSVLPGQQFSSTIRFLNTGTQTWSGSAYYYASQNPALNQTWGGNGVSLAAYFAAPGQVMDVTFTATAPTTPGTYNFQWQMYQNGGAGFFGQMSTNVVIQVGAAQTDNATFSSQSVPTMAVSQSYSVSVTMTNSGTSTWTAGNYYLGSQNAQGNTTWGLNRVNLTSSVAPGAQRTFTFNVTAPSTPGTYNFQWRMAKDGAGPFGAMSDNLAIMVASLRHGPMIDVDHDGMADLGYYRDGVWGFLKSSQSYSLGSAQFFSWGGSGMAPIAADFDGDGKVDLAYIVPPAGGQSAAYAILKSSANYEFGQAQFVPAGFPSLGDTPVVGDFDGDGKADPGIWRSSQGVWIIPRSSSNYTTYIFAQWGQAGDTPIVGDFDGDGRSDLGFYRNGLWGFLKSSQSYSLASAQFLSWGSAGLAPIVADFDGDGRLDLAYVAPPANGQSAVYSILRSSTGYSFGAGDVLFVPAGFPILGDTPLVADFDNDGKADPGIWRASEAVWIVPRSSTNYTSFIFAQWGLSGDVALPGTLTQY